MTGFRLAKGGAQERFGITPDLSCFGKVIGGGLPVGAFGGRAEIMDCLAPLGPVYQAGTLSGNPVAMAAGIAALEELAASDAYTKLEQLGAALEAGMKDAAKAAGVPVQFNRCGSMFCGYFTSEPVHNVAEAMKSDRERFKSTSTACWRRESTSRRRNSRRASSRRRTRRRTSRRRWRRRRR